MVQINADSSLEAGLRRVTRTSCLKQQGVYGGVRKQVLKYILHTKSAVMSGLQTDLDLEVPVTKQGLAGYHQEKPLPLAAIITILLLVISSIALGLLIGPRINKSICIIAENTINRIIDARITRKTQNIVVKQAILQSSLDARINALIHGYHKATQAAEQDMIRKTIGDYVTSALDRDRADREVGLDTRINKAYDTRQAAGQEQLHQIIDARVTNSLEAAGLTNQEGLRWLIDARIRESHRVRKTSEQDQLQEIIDARISHVIELDQAAFFESITALIKISINDSREARRVAQQELIGTLVDSRIGAAIEADGAAQRSVPREPVTARVGHLHEMQRSPGQALVLHAVGAQVDSMPNVKTTREDRLRVPVAARITQTSRKPRTTSPKPIVTVANDLPEIMPVMTHQRAGAGLVDRKNPEQTQQRTLLYLTFGKALFDIKTHIPDDYSSGVILTSTFRISQVISAAITALGALQLNDSGPGEVARKAMHDHFKSIIGFLAEHNYSMCCGVLGILTELREHVCVALQGGVVNDGPGVQFDLLRLLREGL
ncbi:hypothetical protein LTS10_005133 [Elasticomyces elasticus]|nr:hypothetical protein LTS10_005133 [Elasticomyces elasticus]